MGAVGSVYLERRQAGNVTVLRAHGVANAAGGEELRARVIETIAHGARRIVVDVEELGMFDETVVTVLLACQRLAAAVEGRVVVGGASEALADVLRKAGHHPAAAPA